MKKIIGTEQSQAEQQPVTAADSALMAAQDFLKTAPNYRVVEMTEVDAQGNKLLNEDGTVKLEYRLVDKDGKLCDTDVVKKHLNASLLTGAKILVELGAAVATAKDNPALAITFTALALKNIKPLKEQIRLMRECKSVLEVYERTMTAEGTPKDAAVDLADVEGFNFLECEKITKSSEEIKNELLASREEGKDIVDTNLEDIDFDDLLK